MIVPARSTEQVQTRWITAVRGRRISLGTAPGCAVRHASTRTADVLDLDPHRRESIAALDREFNLSTYAHHLQLIGQIREPPGRLSVGADDDVTELTRLVNAVQPSFGGGQTGQSTDDHHTFNSEPRRDRLICSDDAYSGSRNTAFADKLGHNPVHRVDRNREANTGVGSGWRNDRGGYANQSPRRIQQRTS